MSRSKHVAKTETALVVIALVLAGFVAWYVLHVKQAANAVYDNRSEVTVSRPVKTAPATQADDYSGWKTYTAQDGSLQFKYPGTWFVREDAELQRVYVSTVKTAVTKDDTPANFQQVWFTTGTAEASANSEASVKKGEPTGRTISGKVTAGSITASGRTIRTYEYGTIGGPSLEAFWSNSVGLRFYATTATEVGQTNQQNMVTNLKKMLASVVIK